MDTSKFKKFRIEGAQKVNGGPFNSSTLTLICSRTEDGYSDDDSDTDEDNNF